MGNHRSKVDTRAFKGEKKSNRESESSLEKICNFVRKWEKLKVYLEF